MSNPFSRFRSPDKCSYYVWFLGARESRGLRGREFITDVVDELLQHERYLEAAKVTLHVSSKGLKISQHIARGGNAGGNGKTRSETVKHFIPDHAISFACQEHGYHDDIVSCILLIYNPSTHCPVHVHTYRCDSAATASSLTARLAALAARPDNSRRVEQMERQLISRGLLALHDASDTATPARPATSTAGEFEQQSPISRRRLLDSLVEELRHKLGTRQQTTASGIATGNTDGSGLDSGRLEAASRSRWESRHSRSPAQEDSSGIGSDDLTNHHSPIRQSSGYFDYTENEEKSWQSGWNNRQQPNLLERQNLQNDHDQCANRPLLKDDVNGDETSHDLNYPRYKPTHMNTSNELLKTKEQKYPVDSAKWMPKSQHDVVNRDVSPEKSQLISYRGDSNWNLRYPSQPATGHTIMSPLARAHTGQISSDFAPTNNRRGLPSRDASPLSNSRSFDRSIYARSRPLAHVAGQRQRMSLAEPVSAAGEMLAGLHKEPDPDEVFNRVNLWVSTGAASSNAQTISNDNTDAYRRAAITDQVGPRGTSHLKYQRTLSQENLPRVRSRQAIQRQHSMVSVYRDKRSGYMSAGSGNQTRVPGLDRSNCRSLDFLNDRPQPTDIARSSKKDNYRDTSTNRYTKHSAGLNDQVKPRSRRSPNDNKAIRRADSQNAIDLQYYSGQSRTDKYRNSQARTQAEKTPTGRSMVQPLPTEIAQHSVYPNSHKQHSKNYRHSSAHNAAAVNKTKQHAFNFKPSCEDIDEPIRRRSYDASVSCRNDRIEQRRPNKTRATRY